MKLITVILIIGNCIALPDEKVLDAKPKPKPPPLSKPSPIVKDFTDSKTYVSGSDFNNNVRVIYEPATATSSFTDAARIYVETPLTFLSSWTGSSLSPAITLPNSGLSETPFHHAIINFKPFHASNELLAQSNSVASWISVIFFSVSTTEREAWNCAKLWNSNICNANDFSNEAFYELPPEGLYPEEFSPAKASSMPATPFVGLQCPLSEDARNTLSSSQPYGIAPNLVSYGGSVVGVEIKVPTAILDADTTVGDTFPQPALYWGWKDDQKTTIGPQGWFVSVDHSSGLLRIGFDVGVMNSLQSEENVDITAMQQGSSLDVTDMSVIFGVAMVTAVAISAVLVALLFATKMRNSFAAVNATSRAPRSDYVVFSPCNENCLTLTDVPVTNCSDVLEVIDGAGKGRLSWLDSKRLFGKQLSTPSYSKVSESESDSAALESAHSVSSTAAIATRREYFHDFSPDYVDGKSYLPVQSCVSSGADCAPREMFAPPDDSPVEPLLPPTPPQLTTSKHAAADLFKPSTSYARSYSTTENSDQRAAADLFTPSAVQAKIYSTADLSQPPADVDAELAPPKKRTTGKIRISGLSGNERTEALIANARQMAKGSSRSVLSRYKDAVDEVTEKIIVSHNFRMAEP